MSCVLQCLHGNRNKILEMQTETWSRLWYCCTVVRLCDQRIIFQMSVIYRNNLKLNMLIFASREKSLERWSKTSAVQNEECKRCTHFVGYSSSARGSLLSLKACSGSLPVSSNDMWGMFLYLKWATSSGWWTGRNLQMRPTESEVLRLYQRFCLSQNPKYTHSQSDLSRMRVVIFPRDDDAF